MIEINNYSEISFLRWINSERHYVKNEGELEILIEDFLVRRIKYWDLKFLLVLFQDFSINTFYNSDSFHSFCETDIISNYIFSDNISKRPSVHEYLKNFMEYLKDTNEFSYINDSIKRIAIKAYHENTSLQNWFHEVIELHRDKLIESYYHYTRNFLSFIEENEFAQWIEIQRRIPKDPVNNVDGYSFSSRRKNLFSYYMNSSSTHYSAMMLDSSLNRVAFRMDFDFLFIDFLQFLGSKNLDFVKNINIHTLRDYIEEYCFERPGVNKKALIRFSKSINKKDNYFISIFHSFLEKIGGVKESRFNLNRIYVPKIHGVLLFPRHQNPADFLKNFWEDIHHKTSDTIDIYYTKDDLKRNKSGYDTLKYLQNFHINNVDLPAFMVWEHFGGNIETIELDGLDHKDVFNVICFLTNKAESGLEFKKCLAEARNKVLSLKEEKKYKNTIYQFIDSNVGSAGDNHHSYNNFNNKLEG